MCVQDVDGLFKPNQPRSYDLMPPRYYAPKNMPLMDTLERIEHPNLELYSSHDAFFWRSNPPLGIECDDMDMPMINKIVTLDTRPETLPVKGDFFYPGPFLSIQARDSFSQSIDINAIPWVKNSGEADFLFLPKELARFIMTVDEIVSFYRSTLVHQGLWKFIRVRGSITSRSVEKSKQQRGVTSWHIEDKRVIKPDTPNFTQTWIGVSDILPTVVAGHVSKDKPDDSFSWVYFNKRYVRDIQRVQPYQMNVMSGYTWHMGDCAPHDMYRNYIHLIFDIDRRTMTNNREEISSLI